MWHLYERKNVSTDPRSLPAYKWQRRPGEPMATIWRAKAELGNLQRRYPKRTFSVRAAPKSK